MIYYRLHAIHTSHNPYAALWPSLHTTCYMLHTTCFTTRDVLNFLPICAFSTTLLYMLHALLQATYSTFILSSPDSVRLTGVLCRISHRISTDTFLSCTLILTPLKTFILYFMLDIFCLASIHANRCQYQRSGTFRVKK